MSMLHLTMLCVAVCLIGVISAHNLCPNLRCNSGSNAAAIAGSSSLGASPCSLGGSSAASSAAAASGGCAGAPIIPSGPAISPTSSVLRRRLTGRGRRVFQKFTSGLTGGSSIAAGCGAQGHSPCSGAVVVPQPVPQPVPVPVPVVKPVPVPHPVPVPVPVPEPVHVPVPQPVPVPAPAPSPCSPQPGKPCGGSRRVIIDPIAVAPQPMVSTGLGCQGGAGPCARPAPKKQVCLLGRCVQSANAQTKGDAIGTLTQSAGNSAVSMGAGGLHGIATHQAAGKGVGQTGASSATNINSQDMFGFQSLQSGGNANSFGDSSLSLTKSNTKTLGGVSFTNSQARGEASGFGHSATSTNAKAGKCGLSIC